MLDSLWLLLGLYAVIQYLVASIRPWFTNRSYHAGDPIPAGPYPGTCCGETEVAYVAPRTTRQLAAVTQADDRRVLRSRSSAA